MTRLHLHFAGNGSSICTRSRTTPSLNFHQPRKVCFLAQRVKSSYLDPACSKRSHLAATAHIVHCRYRHMISTTGHLITAYNYTLPGNVILQVGVLFRITLRRSRKKFPRPQRDLNRRQARAICPRDQPFMCSIELEANDML